MNYVLIAAGAYLVVGVVLTYNVLKIPRRRLRFWDVAVGAVIMPVLSAVLFLCVLFEPLWKRLLIALDYNPPEEMRAGPKPASEDSKKV
ncbi:MAG: hypothetical protein K2P94_11635 [Rhodospirillaceae bacterium]|nr:hypothetical protein [Rhodospirillaceae bacterium]